MPFVLRQIEPVALSRGVAGRCDDLDSREAISNATLAACLRQLASLVKFAAEMFADFESQAGDIDRRSRQLRSRLVRLQQTVDVYDSRTLPVPEGDLATFSQSHKTNHFKSATTEPQVALNLFSRETRPAPVECMYSSARPAVTPIVRHLSGSAASGDPSALEAADYDRLVALGATLRRKKRIQHRMDVLDIETRRPASLAQLREWLTDDEAIGHLAAAVGTDNRRHVTSKSCDGTIHRLPSPEEKARVAAQVFAAEVIRMDVTGRGFERMSQFRRSLMHVEYQGHTQLRHGAGSGGSSGAQRRRSKRHAAKKRRNTIACDGDRREIHVAIQQGTSDLQKEDKERSGSRSSLRQRLNLVHLLRTGGTSSKNSAAGSSWSAAPASDISYDDADTTITQTETDATSHASSDAHHLQMARAPILASVPRVGDTLRPRRLGAEHTFLTSTTVQVHRAESNRPEPSGGHDEAAEGQEKEAESDAIYETMPESEREFGTLGVVRPPPSASVKLRGGKDNDGARSSSGNWSGSSSTRASLDSDHPKSGGAGSASLSPPSRRQRQLLTASNRSLDSALSDCGSQSTSAAPPQRSANQSAASPDDAHPSAVSDTSSIYSCDAEGYYTSFHIDSGLKTLKEGQSESSLSRSQPLTTSGSRSSDTTRTTPGDNEYELFGRGSTSTTTSSVGTVIFRPEASATIPERRRSAPPEPPPRNRDTVVVGAPSTPPTEEKQTEESVRSASVTEAHQRGDGTESEAESRERIRQVTRIGRIPALCVVTPPPSDDESLRSASVLESHIQMAFLQHVAGDGSAHPVRATPPRVNLMECSQASIPPPESNQIVIKAAVVKSAPESGGLVSLDTLPGFQSTTAPLNGHLDSAQTASSAESSRSSSLERKRRQGARVTLDADGKVVYSSDSLRRRKGAHTTFEPGPHIRSDSAASNSAQDAKSPRPVESSAFRPTVRTEVHFSSPSAVQVTKNPRPVESSALRPVPIGSGLPRSPESSRRSSAPTIPPALSPPSCVAHVNGWRQHRPTEPPPFRPAPSFARTQPDGDTGDGRSSACSPPNGAGISRSDSYKLANEEKVNGASPFQRNDSYRMANQGQRSNGPINGQLNGNHQRSTSAAGMLHNNINNNKMRPSAPLDPLDVWNLNGRAVVDGRRSSSPAIRVVQHPQRLKSPVRTSPAAPAAAPAATNPLHPVNPNVNGRRTYGGPRILLNPKNVPPVGSSSSLNSAASGDGSFRIDQSALKSPLDKRPVAVVRPPTSLHERPSFFTSTVVPQSPPGASGDLHSPIPGYQSLSPPPRMSALPLAVPGSSEPSHFQRHRYNSLPARFKSDDRSAYARWLPASSGERSDSPEEGGFLEYNNNKKATAAPSAAQNGRSSSSSSDGDGGFHSGPLSGATNTSPTPSLSSCSLDMSFTSSVADSVAPTLGTGLGWPTNQSRPSSRASLDSPANHSQRHLLVRRNSDVTAAFNRSVTPEMARGGPLTNHRQVAAPVLSPKALTKPTPMLDFKRKLLQQSQKTSPTQRISAVELLKATKPPPSVANQLNNNSNSSTPQQPESGQSPISANPTPEGAARRAHRVNYISNRLTNRRWCNSPRTDVLSATIVEGRSEEELADSRPDSSVRRHLNFNSSPRRRTPSSGSSTPIETSL